jgi:RHS repeat-associated protein
LKNNYLYQGAYSELDDDIGWNYFALRNYDAQIGRWVQQDPYQEFATPYTYVGNDPINLIDPSGGLSWPPGGVINLLSKSGETVSKALKISGQVAKATNTLNKVSILLHAVTAAVNIIGNDVNTSQVGRYSAVVNNSSKVHGPNINTEENQIESINVNCCPDAVINGGGGSGGATIVLKKPTGVGTKIPLPNIKIPAVVTKKIPILALIDFAEETDRRAKDLIEHPENHLGSKIGRDLFEKKYGWIEGYYLVVKYSETLAWVMYMNEHGGGKNAQHSNAKAREAARQRYESAKKEFEALRSKPKKTKEDVELMKKAEKQMKHWKQKMDNTGENHSQTPKGN